MSKLTSIEICAGAGGQALGLELAGFKHLAAIEIDADACKTLSLNRPSWNVIHADLKKFNASSFRGVDLFAGGVPCPPFSLAGKQLGQLDDRDLFPDALRLIKQCTPRAVMLENVRGLSSTKFNAYRQWILSSLSKMGYRCDWRVVNASDFGVPQLRPRFILVGILDEYAEFFSWPSAEDSRVTVGDALADLMAAKGWRGADKWAKAANKIAPTLVGGSKKHGGADLGPTRAKRQWLELGVDGKGLVDDCPDTTVPESHIPRLTLRMAARIQGFPDSWQFSGRKTTAYRQIGNAFPPPVASAIGKAIADALKKKKRKKVSGESLFDLG
jgi:DNA (cytosine-5)-methyltransferase 1